MRLDILSALNREREKRSAVAVVTPLTGEGQRLVLADAVTGDPLAEDLSRAFRAGRSRIVAHEGGEYFIDVHVPSPRLVIIGAVHIAQALAAMGERLGYDITIIDPRTAFASPERFPTVVLRAQWPEDALPDIGLDRFTAVAALTHDPRIDDPALTAALTAGCFYVGALGSRKTHARRLERLAEQGIPADILSRIRAPIGLAIGAISPEEIAVSILAEITQVLRKGEDL
ncbi:hypothetical protein GCM10007276_19170 [Agaricicola taiwanensis]|uniref:XdhC Rossmann domain-containing protein n=2 Tax=Agaricicola taiwanensis TaxID=591372 RepID=A0A8J2VWU0_9RHOB|nr:hypothetical protein GCM10007276_19170 [Agaricicola taiwanensis]